MMGGGLSFPYICELLAPSSSPLFVVASSTSRSVTGAKKFLVGVDGADTFGVAVLA
jgi:hypothetical protein